MVGGAVVFGRTLFLIGLHFLAWAAAGAFWPVLRSKRGAAVFAVVSVSAVATAAWMWASRHGGPPGALMDLLRHASVAWIVTIGVLAFAVGPLAVAKWLWGKVRKGATPEVEAAPDPGRRALLRLGAAVPMGAVATSGAGTVGAGRFVVREVDVPVKGLPAGLDGFRIGQTTDVHVGSFIAVEDLREALDALDAAGVHLHVMTGDLIDDPDELDATIAAMASVKAPLGMKAILGNHEHWMGRMTTERGYAKADPARLRLLVNERDVVEWNGARLHVAGIDYPLRKYGPRDTVAKRFTETTLAGVPAGEPVLFLSHHPDLFPVAAERNVTLQLSGHTHGGQVGFFGRSITGVGFRYPLGHYRLGESQLYVSGGTGHWFPFRLGVPREVTVLTLRRT